MDEEAAIFLSSALLALRATVAQMVILMAEQSSHRRWDPENVPDAIVAVVFPKSEETVAPETEF